MTAESVSLSLSEQAARLSQGYQKPSSLQRAVTAAELTARPSASALSNIYAAHSRSMIVRLSLSAS